MLRHRLRGGIHPDDHKGEAADRPIEAMSLPDRLYVPVQQHIGEASRPEVVIGQYVEKGRLIARAQGGISANVHAPTSGTIADIEYRPAPHASGLPVETITIEVDGEDHWLDASVPVDPFDLEPEEIAARAADAGVVGMGGATFPSAVKLNVSIRQGAHTLIINACECEPYLSCDDRLMRERPLEILEGALLLHQALGAQRTVIAVEDNKAHALSTMEAVTTGLTEVRVLAVPTRYPMGSDRRLIAQVTGREVPAGRRATDVGMLVHNVGTVYALQQAIRHGRALVSRVVTVAGDAVARPRNLQVPIGTPVRDLLEYCGLDDPGARLIMGGPMMGSPLPHAGVPVVKGTSGILALVPTPAEAARPCVRCGHCVDACPVGLTPLDLVARVRAGELEDAEAWGLSDCLACGCCSYVCPSSIPLAHYLLHGKGALAQERNARNKRDETRRLAEARQARLAQEQARKAAQARAKAKETDS